MNCDVDIPGLECIFTGGSLTESVGLPDLRWHAIGQLETYYVMLFFHSIGEAGSPDLAGGFQELPSSQLSALEAAASQCALAMGSSSSQIARTFDLRLMSQCIIDNMVGSMHGVPRSVLIVAVPTPPKARQFVLWCPHGSLYAFHKRFSVSSRVSLHIEIHVQPARIAFNHQ